MERLPSYWPSIPCAARINKAINYGARCIQNPPNKQWMVVSNSPYTNRTEADLGLHQNKRVCIVMDSRIFDTANSCWYIIMTIKNGIVRSCNHVSCVIVAQIKGSLKAHFRTHNGVLEFLQELNSVVWGHKKRDDGSREIPMFSLPPKTSVPKTRCIREQFSWFSPMRCF